MFVDEIEIEVIAGNGGKGCVSFRREKFVPKGGPDGGDGGDGGSVVLKVDMHRSTLSHLRTRKHYRAKNGKPGLGSNKKGGRGKSLTVPVPRGTLIKDPDSGELLMDLTRHGERFLAADGGKGGRGNTAFKTSTNRAPRKCEEGLKGQVLRLTLELKLLADIGLLGFPSAGKSTLISRLSDARPKVAAYPFTTLVPHLGVVNRGEASLVMADIPGIIEGAHTGTGLGIEFLKHVERTRLLVHLVDMSNTTRDPLEDYETLNHELKKFSPGLTVKPQVLAPNKLDALDNPEKLEALRRLAQKENIAFFPISAATGEGCRELLNHLFETHQALLGQEALEAEEEETPKDYHPLHNP